MGSAFPSPDLEKLLESLVGGENHSGDFWLDFAEHQTLLCFEVCSEMETVIKSLALKFLSIMKWL